MTTPHRAVHLEVHIAMHIELHLEITGMVCIMHSSANGLLMFVHCHCQRSTSKTCLYIIGVCVIDSRRQIASLLTSVFICPVIPPRIQCLRWLPMGATPARKRSNCQLKCSSPLLSCCCACNASLVHFLPCLITGTTWTPTSSFSPRPQCMAACQHMWTTLLSCATSCRQGSAWRREPCVSPCPWECTPAGERVHSTPHW